MIIEISPLDMMLRLFTSVMSLYMMAVLIRWLSTWIELDLAQPRLRWIPRITDPPIAKMRQWIPPMGPVDFAPIAVLVAAFAIKVLVVSLFTRPPVG